MMTRPRVREALTAWADEKLCEGGKILTAVREGTRGAPSRYSYSAPDGHDHLHEQARAADYHQP